MLQITPHHRLRLTVKPADFRRGIDGLAALCRQSLNEDPFNGTIFIFTNRSKKAVKILVFDGNGFWLCTRRFSKGRLAWWPTQNLPTLFLNPSQLHILLAQGNPMEASIPPDWRPLLPTPLDATKGESEQTAQASLCRSMATNLLAT